MHYTFEFNGEHGYVLLSTSGKASVEGFRNMTEALVSDPEWKPGLNLLMDHRALDSRGLQGSEIRQMTLWRADPEKTGGIARIASVVETDLGFGLVRMWDAYMENLLKAEHRIFGSLEEARRWLEEPPPGGAEGPGSSAG